MTYPTKYARQFDFQSYQNANPTRPLPGDKVNFDLNELSLSVGEVVDFISGVVRADGRLTNGSVGVDQLDASLVVGFSIPTTWEAGTIYAASSTVFYQNAFYQATLAHTAGLTFDPAKWSLIADFGDQAAIAVVKAAEAAVSAAAAAASVVLTHADVVLTHADVVLTHADVVSTHADVVSATSSASTASTAAVNAAASAAAAAASVAALSATSTSSILIGTGAKTFVTQSGKLFVAGQALQIASAANSAKYMHGIVTSYTGTSLVMSITDVGGSGTFADWNISISGTQGTIGPAGPATVPDRSVRAATTANGTLATAFANGQTIDGVSLVTGDMILLKNQSAPAENGVYAVQASGAPVRDDDFDTYNEHPGVVVSVQEGTTLADTIWLCTSDKGGTLGTTAIVFAQVSPVATNTTAGISKVSTAASTAIGTATNEVTRVADVAAVYSTIDRKYNAQTGTTYTLVLADDGKFCSFSNASAVTVTVPPNSSVAFPVGAQIDVAQLGAGKVTLAQGAGVTINSVSSNKAMAAQYAGGTLVQTATDTWLLVGSLIA